MVPIVRGVCVVDVLIRVIQTSKLIFASSKKLLRYGSWVDKVLMVGLIDSVSQRGAATREGTERWGPLALCKLLMYLIMEGFSIKSAMTRL